MATKRAKKINKKKGRFAWWLKKRFLRESEEIDRRFRQAREESSAEPDLMRVSIPH